MATDGGLWRVVCGGWWRVGGRGAVFVMMLVAVRGGSWLVARGPRQRASYSSMYVHMYVCTCMYLCMYVCIRHRLI